MTATAKRYHRLKTAGLCIKCGKQKAHGGKVRCLNCSDAQTVDWLRRSDKCRAEKLCVVCGMSDCERLKAYRMCAACAARHRHTQDRLRTERKASNLCLRCGRKIGSDIYTYLHCAICREKARIIQAERRSRRAAAQKSKPPAAKPKKPTPPKSKPAAAPKSNNPNFDPNQEQATLATRSAKRAAEKAHDRKLNAQWRDFVTGTYNFYGT